MDKKNTTIGVLLLIAAFASIYIGQRFSPPRPVAPPPTTNPAPTVTTPSTNGVAPTTPPISTSTVFALPAKDPAAAEVITLENEYVAVHFMNFGGAIRDVALKKFPAELGSPDPYVLNASHTDPMLAFVEFPGLDRNTAFELVSHTQTEIVYRAVFDGRFEVIRRYSLVAQPDDKHDPYQLRHETTFRNLTDQPIPLPRVALNVGTAAPENATVYGRVVTTGFSSGNGQTFINEKELTGGSGFLGIGASSPKPFVVSGGPIAWSAVDNQFFASILTPDHPAAGMITRRVKLHPELPDESPLAFGLTGATQFDLAPLAAHGEANLGLTLYVGPKEYHRLANTDAFKADEDKVMQFGKVFGFFSQLLNTLMTWMHGLVSNWGIAIILTTLTLKTLSLPFTLAASRSAKRMQKIQPEMQAVREKFKDNPQKLQAATMELFKKHKVNPMGGCIPVLITMPFFFGFYTMLRSTAELRFVPFLWANDLSAPDTVGHVFGLPINILPVLMGATMVIQMHLTPSPTVDNAQAKMMKFMPYVFALFCYNFSCALALYSTVNGIFTIGQQLVINRMKDPTPVATTTGTPPAGGKPMKNVTPSKKR
jgi:YidC/Oxa1 family membrane protein insertase